MGRVVGNVEAMIIKDMSRLGRDYLKVVQVMEILRQRGVRLITINDGVDSANGENDFTPFLNILYEFILHELIYNETGNNKERQKKGSRTGEEDWPDYLHCAGSFQQDQQGNHERQNQAYAEK